MEQGKFVPKLHIMNRKMVKDYYREDNQSGQSKDGQSILHSICSAQLSAESLQKHI